VPGKVSPVFDPLEALVWHWGDAYIIINPAPGAWAAYRRDTRELLRAEGPDELREEILADYMSHKVPRTV
jgi:hypothetical protein